MQLGAPLALLLTGALASASAPMPELVVCHGFGCRLQETVRLEDWELRALAGYLGPRAADAASERLRLSYALGLMETLVGRHTPTHLDRAGNPWDIRGAGQLDCIDESLNATTYLRLFEALDWLRWHRVRERAFRAPLILDQHWSAQIEELASGELWVVDSWPGAHGQPALVQPTKAWRWKRRAPPLAGVAQTKSTSSNTPNTIR
jgi:hypothetical protein